MSKYRNFSVRIKNKTMLTFNKEGVIDSWDLKVRKYIVEFDNNWIGWYNKKDLEFIQNEL
jgi:hypothetical protein